MLLSLRRALGVGAVVLTMLVSAWPATGLQAQAGVSVAAAESSWVQRASHAAAGTSTAKTGSVKNGAGKRSVSAHAKQALPAVAPSGGSLGLDSIASQLNGTQSVPWSIVIGLTLLTLLPAILLSMTPMVRLLIVFHFLRQALGTQTAPSNQVLMGLGLMMTWFLMQPVMLQVDQQALAPYRAGTISGEQALELGSAPVKIYMLRYARDKDLALFALAGMTTRPKSKDDLPMQVVVPAYMLSELKAGFQIGAVLFLPFLLVDMSIASITTSVGMMQLPPVVISTPVKILLFVMVDGWNLLAGSLLKSFKGNHMGPDMAAELARNLLIEAMVLSAPILLAACLVSVLLSLLQTLTSVQEQTLTVVPRLFVVFLITVVTMPWLVRRLVTYTVALWSDFHRYLG